MYYFYNFCCHSNRNIYFITKSNDSASSVCYFFFCSLQFHAALELDLKIFSVGILHLKYKCVSFLQLRITWTVYLY